MAKPTYAILSGIIILLGTIPAFGAQTTQLDHSISIVLSNSCITLIQNNITDVCPGYDYIQTLHPDTSNHFVSGGFMYDESGTYYHREKPKTDKSYLFYTIPSDSGIIFLDPPNDIFRHTQRIIIEPSIPEYKLPNEGSSRVFDSYNNETGQTDHYIKTGFDRHVSKNCVEARISAENYIFLLGDTIQYMLNDCDESFTNFNHTKITYLEYMTHDITTSYKYKLDLWVHEMKIKCKVKC